MQNPSLKSLELISEEFLLFEVLDVSPQESWDETHEGGMVEREEEAKASLSL